MAKPKQNIPWTCSENPDNVVKPVLSFSVSDKDAPTVHKIQLWVGNPGNRIAVGEHRCFNFYTGKTASLVYEEQSHGHNATEVDIYNESTWKWVQKWMERGLIADGLMQTGDSQHWVEYCGAIKSRESFDAKQLEALDRIQKKGGSTQHERESSNQ